MSYVLGALAGLIWGAAAALLNARISAAAIKKENNRAMLGASVGRMGVDIAALGVVFLLRKVLPFSYEAALVATAVALSLLTIVLAFRMSKPSQKKDSADE